MRRKVIKASLITYGHSVGNMYDLELSCGHKSLGYGRAESGNPFNRQPPKTASCSECKRNSSKLSIS